MASSTPCHGFISTLSTATTSSTPCHNLTPWPCYLLHLNLPSPLPTTSLVSSPWWEIYFQFRNQFGGDKDEAEKQNPEEETGREG
jgi:hypothetical protein